MSCKVRRRLQKVHAARAVQDHSAHAFGDSDVGLHLKRIDSALKRVEECTVKMCREESTPPLGGFSLSLIKFVSHGTICSALARTVEAAQAFLCLD
eukprot:1487482-Pleurochrysis_carterae.AAC.1